MLILKLFRLICPAPSPAPAMPRWLDLVGTLAAWKPPEGISFTLSAKPATGVVIVCLQAEHFESIIRITAADTVPLFLTLHMHAEEVLRRSEQERQARERGEAGIDGQLAAASAAFHKGIGVQP